MRVIATVEARMASSRLPGKTLMLLHGKPVLHRVVERIQLANRVDAVIVATTTNPQDDVIVSACREAGIACHRGSESDVLGRVIEAGKLAKADVIVQLGADCPFYDPALIDQLVGIYLGGSFDYVTNDIELTYPEGVDAHIVALRTLEEVVSKTSRPQDHDDVPRYIWEHPDEYRIFNLRAPAELHAPNVRLTLDYPEDYRLTELIYAELYPANPAFTTSDVLSLVRARPELLTINAHCKQLTGPYVG